MSRLPSKSRFAFETSSEVMRPNRKGHLYLWTWTFPGLVEVPEAKRRWSLFLKRFRERKRYHGFKGLRVFEMHDQHGLHIHVVTANYLWVNDVRALWRACGGGRIHVVPIPYERRNYLAKYMSKSRRPDALRRTRLWAAFGGMAHTKVKDVEVDSPFTRAYKTLVASVEGFQKLQWWFRKAAVTNLMHGKAWNWGLRFEVIPSLSPEHQFSEAVHWVAPQEGLCLL